MDIPHVQRSRLNEMLGLQSRKTPPKRLLEAVMRASIGSIIFNPTAFGNEVIKVDRELVQLSWENLKHRPVKHRK